MKNVIFALTCVLYVPVITAQYYRSSERCLNPNGRSGTCVSIYDCQTLLSVLQRDAVRPDDVRFVRDSQCYNGIGNGPYVCCSGDTGFQRAPQTTRLTTGPTYSTTRQQIYSSPNANFYDWDSQATPAPTFFFADDRFEARPSGSGVREGRGESDSLTLPAPPVCGGGTIQNRILGGEDAGEDEFPWMVMFEYASNSGRISSNCAGSLINRRYVLTAAHCVMGAIEKRVGKLVSLRLGEHDTSASQALRVGFEELIPHESFKESSRNKENDIALVRLDRNVRYSDGIRPICLPSVMPPVNERSGNTHYTVAGWGRTVNQAVSVVKQKLNVPAVDEEECRRRFRSLKVNIVSSHICAGGRVREDSCEGDSGGPLMRSRNGYWVLEGIVSFGVKCGLKDWPSVNTRVANYEDWIRSKLRE